MLTLKALKGNSRLSEATTSTVYYLFVINGKLFLSLKKQIHWLEQRDSESQQARKTHMAPKKEGILFLALNPLTAMCSEQSKHFNVCVSLLTVPINN